MEVRLSVPGKYLATTDRPVAINSIHLRTVTDYISVFTYCHMMGKIYCCVVDCHNFSGKIVDGRSVTLHRFPVDKKISKIWKTRVSRKNWQPSSGTKLCSVHFEGGSGPTEEHPLPTIFPHKVFLLSKVTEITCTPPKCPCVGKENRPPLGYIDIPTFREDTIEDYEIPENFDASGLSELETSVHLHDYLGKCDRSQISNIRHTELQTAPCTRTYGVQVNTYATETIKTFRTFGTQTPVYETKSMAVQVTLPTMTIEDVEEEDKVTFYTGLPNVGVFRTLFEEIKPAMRTEKKKKGRPRKLRLIDEFLLVLMRLRLGLLVQDLAQRFCISKSGCAGMINNWVQFLSVFLTPLISWTPREVIKEHMPSIVKRRYPNCRVIIDCTELFTETPQSLCNKSLMYSDYKSHMTWKFLVGISPSGVITFVSDLYTGNISDKAITKKSGLLDLLEPGDAVMADKGFLIADLLTPRGVHLIIPPKRKNSQQMSRMQVEATRRIANIRIHVERAMERIKNFRIIQGVIPIIISREVSNIVKIICCLSNLQPPLIKDSEKL